ncbi:hypothetical protein HDU99_004605, partial [Rhizoclosmatium hyalinum]
MGTLANTLPEFLTTVTSGKAAHLEHSETDSKVEKSKQETQAEVEAAVNDSA